MPLKFNVNALEKPWNFDLANRYEPCIINKDIFLTDNLDPVWVVPNNMSTSTKQGSITHSNNIPVMNIPNRGPDPGFGIDQTLTLTDMVLDHSDPL